MPLFGMAGIVMIARMESPGDRDLIGDVRQAIAGWLRAISERRFRRRQAAEPRRMAVKFALFQILDSYVLSNFLFYFAVLACCFVTMTQVFTFFDLLGDIVKNNIPMSHVITYHLFLTPQLIYDTLPIAVLLSVLVTFGVMTKNNEVTAFKACGISVRRLGLPVLLMSGVLSAALFAFDYSWIPQANQIQDAIQNEIKGRPVQTYLHPERKWIIHDYRIFYVAYFDPSEKMMVEPYVFELDPEDFPPGPRDQRQPRALAAEYQAWVWEQGTARDICGVDECNVQNFTVTTFPEITETPDDFLKEVKQNKQMNYAELAKYIKYLQESGFDTVKLQVQYYKKFAVPVFALIMALISVPFGFLVGNRGAMAGIGVSIAVAMAYLASGPVVRTVGQCELPARRRWPRGLRMRLFSLAGLYLMLRMRSLSDRQIQGFDRYNEPQRRSPLNARYQEKTAGRDRRAGVRAAQ